METITSDIDKFTEICNHHAFFLHERGKSKASGGEWNDIWNELDSLDLSYSNFNIVTILGDEITFKGRGSGGFVSIINKYYAHE